MEMMTIKYRSKNCGIDREPSVHVGGHLATDDGFTQIMSTLTNREIRMFQMTKTLVVLRSFFSQDDAKILDDIALRTSDPPMKFTKIRAPDFDLEKTLDSGQVFHWQKVGDGFVGAIGDLRVYLEQRGEFLKVRFGGPPPSTPGSRSSLPGIVERYFALDHPLAEICDSFPKDPVMNAARNFCRGLRIIRQPKWECLATFICSSMKQVAHIRQISLALRKRFGEQRRIGDQLVYTFRFAAATCTSFGEGVARMQARLSRQKSACDGAARQLRPSGSRGVVGVVRCRAPKTTVRVARRGAEDCKLRDAFCV